MFKAHLGAPSEFRLRRRLADHGNIIQSYHPLATRNPRHLLVRSLVLMRLLLHCQEQTTLTDIRRHP